MSGKVKTLIGFIASKVRHTDLFLVSLSLVKFHLFLSLPGLRELDQSLDVAEYAPNYHQRFLAKTFEDWLQNVPTLHGLGWSHSAHER